MKRPIVAVLLCICTVALPTAARAQHDDHGAMSPDQIGSASVHFETSCAPAVKDDFNKAVALLHSFWFPEATKMFQEIAAKDPNCAMAHWGMGMTQWGNPFGGLRNAQTIERGKAIVDKAKTTGTPTAREKGLIDALAILYTSADAGTQRQRVTAYEAAMKAVADANAADTEVKIFYALSVAQSATPTDKTYAKNLQAAGILEPLFAQMPTHPGLAHYIIHAYDAPPLADKALIAARKYASLAPAIPHALHMPSHTFTRVGSWKESIDTNKKSAEAARKSGGTNEALHALDYQTYAFLQIAQDKSAKTVVDEAASVAGAENGNAFAMAAIPARYALERSDWAMAAALTPHAAPNTPYTEAMTHFARAIGAARSGNAPAATADIEKIAALQAREVELKDVYWAQQLGIQRQVALAWQAYAMGKKDEAIAQLKAAADEEDTTDKTAVTPGPLAPARELLGDMLLEAGRDKEALVAYEATMKKDKAKAATYYKKLLEIAADADTERPELRRAKDFVGTRRSR
jgi:tetratricopeptide (TPR) repeat protein